MPTHTRRTRAGAISLGAFVLSALCASWLISAFDWRHDMLGRRPRVVVMPEFEVPNTAEYSYSGSDDYEIGKAVLYHGLGDAIDHAREADILIFGNSRMPLGLREEFLVPRVEELGLRIYSLGGGHSEQARFPLEVIRKHDLRPRVVIVSGGPHILRDRERMSDLAREAMSMTRFDAAKKWLEVEGAWQLRSALHTHLPQVAFFGGEIPSKWIIYRSSRTGWWRPVREPPDRYPIGFGEERPNYRALLPFASELQQDLEARGAQLVLTVVPYGDTRVGHLPYLQEELSLPTIVPSFEGLETADGSHLDRESARAFTQRFWDEFIAVPTIRERLGLDS